MTPAAKFWVCKRSVELTGEAMEVLGGDNTITIHFNSPVTGVSAPTFYLHLVAKSL